MKIAIASGKGGTGKTTLTVALARAAGRRVRVLDCDVEEPNTHLLLEPAVERREMVTVPVPVVDEDVCRPCGKCAEICRFSAVVELGKGPMFFPELCHGCGGCMLVCPTDAIDESRREVGIVERGLAGPIAHIQGRLKVGEAMATPVIKAVKRYESTEILTLIDSPPGTACSFAAAVRGCDYVLLVTEPTPFGLHDLQLAVAALRQMRLPCGVIVNRCPEGDLPLMDWCRQERIDVHLRIPESRRIAEICSAGGSILAAVPGLEAQLVATLERIEETFAPREEGGAA